MQARVKAQRLFDGFPHTVCATKRLRLRYEKNYSAAKL